MPSIEIIHRHSLGKERAFEAIKDLEASVNSNHGLKILWKDSFITIKGRGVSGSIDILDNRIEIHIEVSFFLRAFSPKIEAAIRQVLNRCCAEEA